MPLFAPWQLTENYSANKASQNEILLHIHRTRLSTRQRTWMKLPGISIACHSITACEIRVEPLSANLTQSVGIYFDASLFVVLFATANISWMPNWEHIGWKIEDVGLNSLEKFRCFFLSTKQQTAAESVCLFLYTMSTVAIPFTTLKSNFLQGKWKKLFRTNICRWKGFICPSEIIIVSGMHNEM